MLKDLTELAPDAGHADAIARVYDRAAGGGRSRGPRDRDADPDATGRYPIFEHTRIVVTTHANLLRRGASRFVPGFWAAIEPGTAEVNPRPPMGLLIDELGLFSWGHSSERKKLHAKESEAAAHRGIVGRKFG